jgi:opacity protein-like surface antigen
MTTVAANSHSHSECRSLRHMPVSAFSAPMHARFTIESEQTNTGGAIMKGTLLGAAAIAALSMGAAAADETSVSRISSLEKENAAIRKEITLMRENRELHKQAAALKPATGSVSPAVLSTGGRKSDPFAAYAADLPMAYKAAPVVAQPRQFRIWGEGGAIWSGGDPMLQPYLLGIGLGIGGLGSNPAGVFDLSPKLGWEGAGGFDYRIANSTWHVSGQFRYGENGKAGDSASGNGSIPPGLFGLGAAVTSVTFSDALSQSYQEKRWLADLAIGKDILGDGPDALQIKGGLRVSESVATLTTDRSQSLNIALGAPQVLGGFPPFSNVSNDTATRAVDRRSFLGAGPLVGLEGSIPLVGGWAFDYLGDAAILFGTQKIVSSSVTNVTVNPAFLGLVGGGIGGGTPGATVTTTERFASMFSADLQVGVSYWLTQNVKLGLSYRMDAMINVQNQDNAAVTNFTPDRFTHGPRIRLTGQF